MGCVHQCNGGMQPRTHEQPEQGARLCGGSTPGVRGKSGASSWAFHAAGPCDP